MAQAIAEVQADVRRAYVERYMAESRAMLLDEMQGLAQRARDAAQARFDAGDAPQLEVLQARLVLADVDNQANAARGAVQAARVTLNALLGFPLGDATPIDMTFDVGLSIVAEAAVARAQSANAELAVLDRRLDEQRARVALARAMRQPDVTPEGTLTRRAEPEFRPAGAPPSPSPPGLHHARRRSPCRRGHAGAAHQRASGGAGPHLRRSGRRHRHRRRRSARSTPATATRSSRRRSKSSGWPKTRIDSGRPGIAAYLQALQSTRDVRLRAIDSAANLQNALADLERAIGAPVTSGP